MSEYTKHMREAVTFQQRQELESFHFKAQTGIDGQDDDICDFGQIYHRSDVVRTLDNSYSLPLVGSESYCSRDLIYFVLGMVLYERADYRGFS